MFGEYISYFECLSPIHRLHLFPSWEKRVASNKFFSWSMKWEGKTRKKMVERKMGRKCQKIIVFNKECEWHANNVRLLNESAKLFNDDWDQWKTNNLILYFFSSQLSLFQSAKANIVHPILFTIPEEKDYTNAKNFAIFF